MNIGNSFVLLFSADGNLSFICKYLSISNLYRHTFGRTSFKSPTCHNTFTLGETQ